MDFSFDGSYVPALVFADDVTLVATSASQLQEMLRALQIGLKAVGLEVAFDKCEWTCNCPDSESHYVVVGDFVLPRSPLAKGLKLLGTQVALVNSCKAEWEHRIAAAWGAFYARNQALCCQQASLRARYSLLMATVHRCLSWGLEVLTPTRAQLKKLDSLQLAMVRKMMRSSRAPGEQWLDWQRRTLRSAREWIRRNKVEAGRGKLDRDPNLFDKWSLKWRRQYLSWAGHLARLPAARLAQQVTLYRNLEWWRRQQASGSVRHPVRFKPWRWEDRIFQDADLLNLNWWAHAIARQPWPAEMFHVA